MMSAMQKHSAKTPLWASIFLAGVLSGCANPAAEKRLEGPTMGTTYSVQIVDCGSSNCEAIKEAIDTRLDQLTRRLSHYDPESELSMFNNYHGTDWFPVSDELGTVINYALVVSEQSHGAFDISIAPAVDAWGFGPTEAVLAKQSSEPSADTLREVLQHSGYKKLESRHSPQAIRKKDPLLRLDLSAIAKGYAVDQLAYLLEDRGLQNYLIEIGGEIRAAGTRSDGTPWRIGIQPPAEGLELEFVVIPGDAAVATSGDYQNFYMLDDRRISHAINPGNARPVDNGLMSVSVIAPDAMQADALATALMVMGAEAGFEFATEHDIAALFIERTENGSRAISSPAFEHYRASD